MIKYQYFEGCPNADLTYKNLMALVKRGFIDFDDIEIVKIENADEAELKQFQGSPTILVNGKDLYTERVPVGFSYTCRLYFIEGKKTGILPIEYIQRKLEKLL